MKVFGALRWLLAVHVFVLPASSQAPPVLTLDGRDGISATLSDYTLSNAGPAPNGGFRGTYCFSLTNTSSEEFYIGAVGLFAAVSADGLVVTSPTGPFVYSQFEIDFMGIPVTAVLLANGFPDVLTSSIAPGNSGSFCMTLTSPNSFTLAGLVNRTRVLFGDEFNARLPPSGFVSSPSSSIGVVISTFQDQGATCFVAQNSRSETVTGFAFDPLISLPAYQLQAVVPTDQPGDQMFEFASPVPYSPGRPWWEIQVFDFGLMTGPSLVTGNPSRGLRRGEQTSMWCVTGAFYSPRVTLEGVFIELPTEVWFQGHRRITFSIYQMYGHAGALRGTVSTAPR